MTSSGTRATTLDALRDAESRYVMGTYARQPLALVHGEGVRVTDSDGRELLDMVAGIAVNVLGHAHPAVRAALQAQAAQLIHTSNLYYTEPQLRLARLLVESAFPSRVFFCNSGAEANEAAIKIARKWGRRHRGGAHRIVTAAGAFHGRTLGTLAATGNPRYGDAFEPLPEGFVQVPFNDLAALEAAVDDGVCAVLLEPVLGESGVVPLDDAVLQGVRRLCDERDVLLMLDEVQTGMGRTGRMWAHQHAGITPDVMTVAKGLGGGVPIGAVLAAPRADVLEPGDHGSTFGGNPLASAAAVAVFETIAGQRLVDNAARMGEYLQERLLDLRDVGVESVRGRGLMVAAVLREGNAPRVARGALDCGVIVNAIGADVIRLVPPLTLTEAEADEAVRRLREGFELALTEGGA